MQTIEGANRAERRRRMKKPGPGPWAWHELIPQCYCVYEALVVRAMEARPPKINIGRWAWWLEAEMLGDQRGIPSETTRTKYRRLLYELHQELDVKHLPRTQKCRDLEAAALAADGKPREPESDPAERPESTIRSGLAAAA